MLSYFSIGLKGEHVKGIKDLVLISTAPLNDYFREDVSRRNALLISCSTMLDLLMIIAFYRWIRYATTWRLFITMGIFYGLRAIIQKLWYVEFPQGYDWGFPGFMSVFVPYGETADFFYSGHAGCCMIQFLEFWSVGWFWMSLYALLTMFAQIFLMIALRSHYTMDLFGGIVIAHYLWIMAEKYSFLVDWYAFGIPLYKRMSKDRGLSKEQIKKELEIQRELGINSEGQSTGNESTNYINYPGGGVGTYFISCRNCSHPLGNYMVNEESVVHISELPPNVQRHFNESDSLTQNSEGQHEGG